VVAGVRRQYEARLVALKDGRILSIVRDITERKEAEEALHQAQADLVRMARLTALGELTVSIAHEINQPLCAIVANANACLNWLERAPATGEIRAALTDVVHDAHRAGQIIARTRELFTNRPPERQFIAPNEVVRDVIDIARERLRRNGVKLRLRLDPALPHVEADDVQIHQVLLNLVQNGVDAMQGTAAGSRVLTVRTRATADGVAVSVRDTGRGLPGPDVERVFEPFFTTKPQGIGIGLSISRSIVANHGGRLWAAANARVGATFTFTIPGSGSHA
jgi:C4-dicarboxylate-specific signal transduction histidine kinase